MRLFRAWLGVWLCGLLWLSQARAQDHVGQPIVDVEIEGEAATMLSVDDLRLPPQPVLSRQLVRDLIRRLIATGQWTDVQVLTEPAQGGVRLSLRLTARSAVARVELRGTRAVRASDLLREAELPVDALLSQEVLDRLRTRLTALYADRGYRAVQVRITLRDTDDPTRKVVLVQVDEGQPTRIARIAIDGVSVVDPSVLRRELRLGKGDVLDQRRVLDEVRRVEQRLRRLGYLEATVEEPAVQFEAEGAVVHITSHVGPLYRVEIVGQEPLGRGEVYQAMKLGEEPLTSATQLGAVTERIQDLYRRLGFVDARADLRQVPEPKRGRAVLRVAIETGRQLQVVAIGFPGARHFERSFLTDQVVSYLEEQLPGTGLLAAVDSDVADNVIMGPGPNRRTTPPPQHTEPARTYYEPAYASAVTHIEQLYQADGFLSVRVGPAQLQRTSDRFAAVAVPITEGPRTMLHAVAITGNEALSARELIAESALQASMPFSYLTLDSARTRLLQLYQERGYLYAKVEPTVRFSPDRTRAEVAFQIVERYQVQVDEIVVRGADRTDESLIRDLVGFRPGDVYRPSVAQESQERLLSLGVFSSVTIAPEDADLPARSKRLNVLVTQRPSQVIDLAAGLSTGQGARGSLEYGYRDLFGQAVSLTLRGELAYQFFFVQQDVAERYGRLLLQDRLERNVTLSLSVPQLLRGTDVRTSVELFHVRDNQRDFGLDKNGVGLTFNYRPIRRLTLTLRSDVENNNIDLFIDAASKEDWIRRLLESGTLEDLNQALQLQRTRVPDGNSYLVAGRISAAYDQRDNPFNPTAGYFATVAAELARTLRTEDATINSQFLKLTATGSSYVSLGRQLVLALQVRVGYIVHLLPHCITRAESSNAACSQTYPNRAFFLGGIDTMRGYFQDSMVPQDQIDTIIAAATGDRTVGLTANSFVRSGDAFVIYRAELRFPIVGELHGATFADVGNLWANPQLLRPWQVRTSVGAGIRLSTPVGPLAFDYGIVVGAREVLDEPNYGTVHFSMGMF